MFKNKPKSTHVFILLIYGILNSSVNCNIIHDFNEELQSITNEIFTSLGLKQNLHLYENIQHMLTAHYKLRNISETNIDIYNILKYTVQDTRRKEMNDLFEIETILNELAFNKSHITEEITFDIQNIINNIMENITLITLFAQNQTYNIMDVNHGNEKNNREVSELKEIKHSSESMAFLEEFLKKIDNLTINNFIDKKTDSFSQETRRFGKSRYYDLKIWREIPKRRIFKSIATGFIDYPFIVSVHVKERFCCAGNIISKTYILTSASCLQSIYNNRKTTSNLPSVSVRIGSDFISKYGEIIPIVTIFFHPKYNPIHLKNNIAILKMEKHMYFRTHRNIRRIDIDDKKRKILDSSHQVTLLGWGSKNINEKVNPHEPLSYTDLNIFNLEMCKEVYSSDFITGTNFCAGFIFKGSGACNKDEGGPAIVNGVLVGVVSFAPTICGKPNSPTVFTKISCYNQWIRGIVNEDVMIKWNHTANDVTFDRVNDTQNINFKEGDYENNVDNVSNKVSEKYILRELNSSKQETTKRLSSHVPPKNKIQESRTNKKFNPTEIYVSKIVLPDNYNFYSVENSYTEEDGLSIEVTGDNAFKQDTSATKENRTIIHYDRKTDVRREKVIEEHFINILENILKISTKKQFQDYLRKAKVTFKSKLTSATQSYKHRIRNSHSITRRKKEDKITTTISTKGINLKPSNIFKKVIDFFTQK